MFVATAFYENGHNFLRKLYSQFDRKSGKIKIKKGLHFYISANPYLIRLLLF